MRLCLALSCRKRLRLPAGITTEAVAALVLGVALGGYRFRVTEQSDPIRLRRFSLVAAPGDDIAALREAVQRARRWANATSVARDLANAPSNVKDPAWLVNTAAGIAGDHDAVTATVRDEKWLTEHGFGGVLAVGSGSIRPPPSSTTIDGAPSNSV